MVCISGKISLAWSVISAVQSNELQLDGKAVTATKVVRQLQNRGFFFKIAKPATLSVKKINLHISLENI